MTNSLGQKWLLFSQERHQGTPHLIWFQEQNLKWLDGTSLVVHWLRLHAPTAEGTVSIPGQGTKISHAMLHHPPHPPAPQKKERAGYRARKGSKSKPSSLQSSGLTVRHREDCKLFFVNRHFPSKCPISESEKLKFKQIQGRIQ